MRLLFKKVHPEVELPKRGYPQSVGLDIKAFLLDEKGKANSVVIPPQAVRSIKTGLVFGGIEAAKGFVSVCSRSGLAQRGLFVANSPGIIDPDYRGEILVLLVNAGWESHYVRHGDRVAQLVVLPIMDAVPIESVTVDATVRGESGFGSTGR